MYLRAVNVLVKIWKWDIFSVTTWADLLGWQSHNTAPMTLIQPTSCPKNDTTHILKQWHPAPWISSRPSQFWMTHNVSHTSLSLPVALWAKGCTLLMTLKCSMHTDIPAYRTLHCRNYKRWENVSLQEKIVRKLHKICAIKNILNSILYLYILPYTGGRNTLCAHRKRTTECEKCYSTII
jgi:hypothetical protein